MAKKPISSFAEYVAGLLGTTQAATDQEALDQMADYYRTVGSDPPGSSFRSNCWTAMMFGLDYTVLRSALAEALSDYEVDD